MSVFVIQANTLKVALQSAAKATGKDDGLPILAAVRLSVSPDGTALQVAATDRYVLLIADAPCDSVEASDIRQAVLSASDLSSAVSFLPRRGLVSVTLTADTISVAVLGGASVSFLSVDGEFPDVARLLPDAEALGTGLGVRALAPSVLSLLASVKVKHWTLGQAGDSATKPVIAYGELGNVRLIALLMPIRTDDSSIELARAGFASVSGKAMAEVAA